MLLIHFLNPLIKCLLTDYLLYTKWLGYIVETLSLPWRSIQVSGVKPLEYMNNFNKTVEHPRPTFYLEVKGKAPLRMRHLSWPCRIWEMQKEIKIIWGLGINMDETQWHMISQENHGEWRHGGLEKMLIYPNSLKSGYVRSKIFVKYPDRKEVVCRWMYTAWLKTSTIPPPNHV